MEWVYIGIVAGSLVTSLHPNKEACEGRKAILAEQKIAGKCVEAPSFTVGLPTYQGSIIYPR